MFVIIIGWAQIEDISVDLPSDMTVLPQIFTLHAIKIGHPDHISFLQFAKWYYVYGNNNSELCSGSKHDHKGLYSCTIGYGEAVEYGSGRWDFPVTVTWNEENITMNQSNNNGDHMFRFNLNFGIDNSNEQAKRKRYISLTGE